METHLPSGEILPVSLAESKKERRVDPCGEKVRYAKSLGICFGDA